jgi:hypothetical protein
MTIIQLLIVAFVLFAALRAIMKFREGNLRITWVIFWILFWFAAGVVAILPQTTDFAARFVGVGRGADLVTYASLIMLFYLVFRLFVKLEEVERQITRLVRKLSLEDLEDEHPTV